MTDIQCKAIMGAILIASLPEIDDDECIFEHAASVAEDLFAHVVSNSSDAFAISSTVPKPDLGN